MRLVRLGVDPAKVGADIRAAIAAWGAGSAVLGGITVSGCRPPGSPRALDAVILLPRGLIVVIGVDLPEPALKIDAPVQTPWTVDGWPLVRTEGAVNPALEALESAAALARSLQSRGLEPLPVAAIVVVGPYAEQVTQPTADLHRGVRVVGPNISAILSAAQELATYESDCAVEPAREVLRVLSGEDLVPTEILVAEGFPESPVRDLAGIDTMLISKYTDGGKSGTRGRIMGRGKLIAAGVALVLLCVILLTVLVLGNLAAGPPVPTVQQADGVEFTQLADTRDTDCAGRSFGDVRHWFQRRPCRSLTRAVFGTTISGRPAAVSVSVIELSEPQSATELRELLEQAGTGGVADLPVDGGPQNFDNAARTVQQAGTQVRVVQAAWLGNRSDPEDVSLRSLAESGLRLAV